jgi:hypothetical protein
VKPKLLDQLVGTQKNSRWNFQTDGLRRLEIDDEVELRRLLHGQISRLGAFENSIHVLSRAAKLTIPVDAVGIPSRRLLRPRQPHGCWACDIAAPKR